LDKKRADTIVTGYMKKIFGFALSKTMNTDKAEELASLITFDVYLSLLKIDTVHNIEGYVYRVAHNVYARFVDGEVRGRYVSLDEVSIPCAHDFTSDFEKDETYIRLRNEVAYLGKTRREVVVMHYFQKLKLHEIARRLNLPLGTVKWHLHDAKNQIKEGLKMREKGTIGMKPVQFTAMGHGGKPGPDGKDTAYYLEKLITQNIAYVAYHEAKTISDIAGELGVPAAYIEDEVAYLEENGFMDKVAGDKYLTNIFLIEASKEMCEQEHTIYTKYAKLVCDAYVPRVFEAMADFKSNGIYAPEDDFNFLMWSAVTYACGVKLRVSSDPGAWTKFSVKRKDGGDYTAFASVVSDFDESELSYNPKFYGVCGDMTRDRRDEYPLFAWQLNTYYDDREGGWIENKLIDFEYLYMFITGKITKDPVHADKFKRLFDKGYLVSRGDSEYVNMIVTTISEEAFTNMLPAMPDDLKAAGKELDAEIYKLNKAHCPPHMREFYRGVTTDCLTSGHVRVRVLEQLVATGALKQLTAEQKHSVNTIMFCDVLPK